MIDFRLRISDMLLGAIVFGENEVKLFYFSTIFGEAQSLGYWIDRLGEPKELKIFGGSLTYGIFQMIIIFHHPQFV